ncbi:Fe-S cluster assembly protein SufD [Oricola thermophila]|uniref:Fe-S cluster assembly protein SufD n=1 Tax=Oricola thermophila TaxID=2742145 RepID=A0A6N1VFR6_9HYPH|nr:Fe-S cluster assembly protein SufD [Oricola thermophila]QKV17807.1 Fe-S cluster assembly protein SufD [Oricola thermophila]
MTVQSKLPLTAAETTLVETFGEQFSYLPGNAEMVSHRDRAVQALKESGLPTRKVEAWHYTDLRRLLTSIPSHDDGAVADDLECLVEGSARLVLNNGKIATTEAVDGITVASVADALRAEVSGVTLSDHGRFDAVGLINSAFVANGFVLKVEDGAEPDRPIELQSLHDGGQVHTRNIVTVGADAKVTLFDRQAGSDKSVLASNVTELVVRKGGDAKWICVQEQGGEATHLGQLNVTLEENAKLTVFVVNLSGQLVRQEINADVVGEGADLTFRAINLIGGNAHCDITLSLGHLVPNTTSTEVVRSVVTDSAQGVFQGQIRVDRIAQKTDAQMACNTLLLSDDAGFSTKPELEIFADDVVCAHGATVAEIDHNSLFYLMARGISEKTARGLLIKAFVAEIIEELDDNTLVEALEMRIDKWLEAYG